MSDNFRQSFTDKAENAIKPDSEKSTTEHITDTLKGKADSVASSVQPESEKSYLQQAGDLLTGNSNENSGSIVDKAKNAIGYDNKSTKSTK